jgi:hypothetical protein
VLKFLLVAAFVAVVVYLLVRLAERRHGETSARRRGLPRVGPQRRPPARPMGPDDDLDFLRDLDRRRRRPAEPQPAEPPQPTPQSQPEEPPAPADTPRKPADHEPLATPDRPADQELATPESSGKPAAEPAGEPDAEAGPPSEGSDPRDTP